MAILKTEEKEIEVIDGDSIVTAAEHLGVPFSCYTGICGVCNIDILEGAENLNDLTKKEIDMGFTEKNKRLACQCRIKSGVVKISF